MSFPKDGTVLNGAFWLNGESWLIMEPQKPLNEYLAQSLQEQRQYIERLTKRADALEQWLARSSVPSRARRTKHGKSLERGGTG